MKKVKVIAHRGANHYAPQNTVPAFQKAIEIGVDGTETDVHATKDGHIVICHNDTVDETSNGKGKIVDYTFEEIRKLDFGTKFSDKFIGTMLPTLREYLEVMSEDKNLSVINVEIKPNKKERHLLVAKTIELSKEMGLFDKLLISSFDYKMLIEAKKFDPKCKTAFLYPTYAEALKGNDYFPIHRAHRIKCDAIHPHKNFITKHGTEVAHKMGMDVNVWTVDEEKDVKRLVAIGVDGLITNTPDKVKNMLK